MTTTLDQAQDAALRASSEADPTTLAIEIGAGLGHKLAAYALDVKEQTFGDWIKATTQPRGVNLDKLRHLARIYKLLIAYDDPHTVRAWFIALNHLLDDTAPAEVFRDGGVRAVQSAARKFVENA